MGKHIYSILHTIFVLIFFAHLLRVKKTPTSTLAWFFIVLIEPYVGLPLYLLFGSRKIRVRHREKPQRSLSVADHDPLQKVLRTSGSPGLCTKNEIHLIRDGVSAFNLLQEKITAAKKSVFVETFIFADDEVGRKLLELLTEKAREGLDVRILLDSLGALLPGHPSFKGFQKAGGKYMKFMPLILKPFRGRMNLRNHRKLIVIDEEFAVTGGMNIAEEYMGPQTKKERWVDIGVLIEGDLVSDLAKMFFIDWSFAVSKPSEEALPRKSDRPAGHRAQLVKGGPDIDADPIYEWLLSGISMARKKILVTTPYFIPDEPLAKALELASKRGVSITLIVPDKSNHLLADLGRRTYLEQMELAGVRILRFPKMIHAKVTVIDDVYGMISSANLDSRSLLINYESGIALYDPANIQELTTWCEELAPLCTEGLMPTTMADDWIGGLARLLSPII